MQCRSRGCVLGSNIILSICKQWRGLTTIFTCARYAFNPRDLLNYEMFLMDERTYGDLMGNGRRKQLREFHGGSFYAAEIQIFFYNFDICEKRSFRLYILREIAARD
ncbi:hypothetical protein RHE_CH01575 [Rhizobium etli CFN 42]|uniref:Uncharacterized protein n=1 Tax=Rhizobium etli (strain ATCC 51251 / DSM 11541 / JCM 21823 / NBRC 15573 / CFN 42) TaxID=347834 RepID=Q2K9V9_RHIEC|nr:hypothetical protein RHE_CH01575 [Rhizobium etli CFN 42]